MAKYNAVFTATATHASAINLTDPTVNTMAAPVSTPRQGGFTIRNRWDCAKQTTAQNKSFTKFAACSASNSEASTLFYVIEVPKRTLVKDVNVFAVDSATIPNHGVSGAASAAKLNSVGAAAQVCFNARMFQKASQTTSSMDDTWQAASEVNYSYDTASIKSSVLGCIFGGLPLAKFDSSGGALDTLNLFEKIDTKISVPNMAGQHPVWMDAAVAQEPNHPVYFPYGGYVTMAIGADGRSTGDSASSSGTGCSSCVGAFSGVWEVQANCQYVPE